MDTKACAERTYVYDSSLRAEGVQNGTGAVSPRSLAMIISAT